MSLIRSTKKNGGYLTMIGSPKFLRRLLQNLRHTFSSTNARTMRCRPALSLMTSHEPSLPMNPALRLSLNLIPTPPIHSQARLKNLGLPSNHNHFPFPWLRPYSVVPSRYLASVVCSKYYHYSLNYIAYDEGFSSF